MKCNLLKGDNFQSLCNIISAGLALEPHFVSATFLSLGLLVQPHSDLLSDQYKNELLTTTLMYLVSPHREVIHAAIDFVQILFLVSPAEIIVPVIPTFIKQLTQWTPEITARFRSRVKIILEKLVRKIGFDVVAPHVPWIKLMTNIRKSIAKEKKKKVGEKAR